MAKPAGPPSSFATNLITNNKKGEMAMVPKADGQRASSSTFRCAREYTGSLASAEPHLIVA